MKRIKSRLISAAMTVVVFGTAGTMALAQEPAPSVHTIQRILVDGGGEVSIEITPPYQGTEGCENATSMGLEGEDLDWMIKILLAAKLGGRQIEIVEVQPAAFFCTIQSISLL